VPVLRALNRFGANVFSNECISSIRVSGSLLLENPAGFPHWRSVHIVLAKGIGSSSDPTQLFLIACADERVRPCEPRVVADALTRQWQSENPVAAAVVAPRAASTTEVPPLTICRSASAAIAAAEELPSAPPAKEEIRTPAPLFHEEKKEGRRTGSLPNEVGAAGVLSSSLSVAAGGMRDEKGPSSNGAGDGAGDAGGDESGDGAGDGTGDGAGEEAGEEIQGVP